MAPDTSPKNIKQKIANIPVVGYAAKAGLASLKLPKHLGSLRESIDSAHAKADRLSSDIKALRKQAEITNQTLADITDRLLHTTEQLDDMKHRLLSAKMAPSEASGSAKSNATTDLIVDDHDLDDFYIKFENKFRGTEDEIKDRLKVYLPRLKELDIDFKKHPVLDIGCGRGELLDLLKENKINAIGLDLNESMVERCKKRGFKAVQADALQYLMEQKSNSLGVITGFHIVEHIPFSFLLRLFEECHRVLVPGGIIVFETPNPENLHVGSFSFYYDPSHLHPLAPDVLAFAVENRGFAKAEILRLHPKGDGHENDNRDDQYVAEVVRRFFMEQDYAVIGHKAK